MGSWKVVRSGGGADFDYSQDHCFVKVSSEDTKGTLCMVEDDLKPGFQLGRHHHKKMTEVFYVLEGEIEFSFDDSQITLSPGDTLTIPPNVWHAAECKAGGKMLTVFHGGCFDQYLEQLSRMTAEQFEDTVLMKTLAERYDIFTE